MITINPKKLYGSWFEGYALDLHTLSSEFLGYDAYGHADFATKRSELGELLYKLKNKSDKSVINDIVNIVVNFLRIGWKISRNIEGIIPIPPSKTGRLLQPVIELARGISSAIGVELYSDYLIKAKDTPELKNIYDFHERMELLKNIYDINNNRLLDGNILLFDDLYRSGATLNAATNAVYEKGKVGRVYVLALTKTRSLR
jgi:competence protein ComFC